MTAAGRFIAELQRERRNGKVAAETEQHLKHEFRTLGWDAPDPVLAGAVDAEIDRLHREAATLLKLRTALLAAT